jgi:tetratricopeptide (TPR) repeat protein
MRHGWPILIVFALVSGCATPASREKITQAYELLNSPSPNYAHMTALADGYLTDDPSGDAAADALYIKGRALEEKAQRDASSPQQDFASAYALYAQALQKSPRPALEGLIRTGMGNVLYFQDRYAAAINELLAGYEKLERDDNKAWALYRIGLCHQRLASWDQADSTFAAVTRLYPNTLPAQRAAEHMGARHFFVQVATFSTPQLADATIADLKKLGVNALRYADQSGRGLQYVRIGPMPNYDSAKSARDRVWGKYRDAMIIP